MTRVVFFDSQGHPSGVSRYANPDDAAYEGGVPVLDSEVTDEGILSTWYLASGKVCVRDPKPSDFHEWDAASEAWVENLEFLQEEMLRTTDQWAESARLRYITPGAGQAMTYEQKYREALGGDGPLLQAEAAALGQSVAEVAQSVLDAHAAWQVAGAHIEALRLKAKADVRVADTAAKMHAIARELELSLHEL